MYEYPPQNIKKTAHRLLIFSVCRFNFLPICKQTSELLIRCAILVFVLRTVAMFTPEEFAKTKKLETKMENELSRY